MASFGDEWVPGTSLTSYIMKESGVSAPPAASQRTRTLTAPHNLPRSGYASSSPQDSDLALLMNAMQMSCKFIAKVRVPPSPAV